MSLFEILYLSAAAMVGSALNAVAGGGSFFTFPALIFSGVPILNANATSTVALWPGAVSSAYTYRNSLHIKKKLLLSFTITSTIGSICGTTLLLYTPPDTLRMLLPYLMLSATLLLIFKNRIANNTWLPSGENNASFVLFLQFIIGVYGGYFGGGMGILMLAAFNLMGFANLQQMNALKSFLGAFINGIAVIIFIITGNVFWVEALVMVAAAIAGGYLGAFLGTKISPRILHFFIISVGAFFTFYFFLKK